MSHLTEEPLGYASMRERHRHRRKYKRRREVEDDGSEEERDNEEVGYFYYQSKHILGSSTMESNHGIRYNRHLFRYVIS
jgi:hypothetical protein